MHRRDISDIYTPTSLLHLPLYSDLFNICTHSILALSSSAAKQISRN